MAPALGPQLAKRPGIRFRSRSRDGGTREAGGPLGFVLAGAMALG